MKRTFAKALAIALAVSMVPGTHAFAADSTVSGNKLPRETATPAPTQTPASGTKTGASEKKTDGKTTVSIGSSGVTIEGKGKEDYLKQYEYKGEDYVYAKAEFLGKKYEITRKEYGKFVATVSEYGINEEYYTPYTGTSEDDSDSAAAKANPPVPPAKEKIDGWGNWDDETRAKYDEWKESFQPDEWQRNLLEYYTDEELFTHYFITGTTIDERAYTDFWKQKLSYEAATGEKFRFDGKKEAEEPAKKVEKPKAYSKLTVKKELDSIFDCEDVYCVEEDSYAALGAKLKDTFNPWTEESLKKIENPNAFSPGYYYFEYGIGGERKSSAERISPDDARDALSLLKSYNTNDETDTTFTFRVCYKGKAKNAKNQEHVYKVPFSSGTKILGTKGLKKAFEANKKDDAKEVKKEPDDAKG